MTTPITTITLTAGTDQVTLINVFNVDPQRQAKLVAALDDASVTIFVTVPGFISANMHASLDGARVINYAQWASEKHFTEALQRADVRAHIAEAAALADSWDPTLVRIASIHRAQGR
jgi:quinol monooxygenase YgiN